MRAALSGIAEDEERHAALAWRFVAWAMTRSDAVGPRLEALLARARAESDADGAGHGAAKPLGTDPTLAEHGVLSRAAVQSARRAALGEVIPPLLWLRQFLPLIRFANG